MGTFSVDFEVGDQRGERWEAVRALVDTGASFSVIPADVLGRLGVAPSFEQEFELADGRVSTLPMAVTMGRLELQALPTLVAFGEAGSRGLLGAYTLETFRVAPDPVGRRLMPVRALLL